MSLNHNKQLWLSVELSFSLYIKFVNTLSETFIMDTYSTVDDLSSPDISSQGVKATI